MEFGICLFFCGWICSILLPILWYIVWISKIYVRRTTTEEQTRDEIMSIPLMFYEKNGCYKPTITPLHFAVQEVLKNKFRRC